MNKSKRNNSKGSNWKRTTTTSKSNKHAIVEENVQNPTRTYVEALNSSPPPATSSPPMHVVITTNVANTKSSEDSHPQQPQRRSAKDCHIVWKPYYINHCHSVSQCPPDSNYHSEEKYSLVWPTHGGKFTKNNVKLLTNEGILKISCFNHFYSRDLNELLQSWDEEGIVKAEVFEKVSYLYIPIRNVEDIDEDSIEFFWDKKTGMVHIRWYRFNRYHNLSEKTNE